MAETELNGTALRTHGGKAKLAKSIVALMPEHKRYLEAYFGGGSVLFAKPCEGVAEWANDLNYELTRFWSVIRSKDAFETFRRYVETTPLSETTFEIVSKAENCKVLPTDDFVEDLVVQAYWFFVRNRMSRQGLGKNYCTPTKRLRRGMNENVSSWLSAVDGLPEFHKRLRRVEIWNRPAVEAIKALDGPDFLTFCDPPYLFETRSSTGEYGDYEMTADQHQELLDTLAQMKGKFLLSGYPSQMYKDAADKNGWNLVTFDIANNASSSKTKERKQECLWMNY